MRAIIAMRINHPAWHREWHTEQAHVVEAKQQKKTTQFHLTIKSISLSLTPEKIDVNRRSMWCAVQWLTHFVLTSFGGWNVGTTKTSQLSMWRETKQSRKMRWLLLQLLLLCGCAVHAYRRWHRSRVAFELLFFTIQRAICHRILEFYDFPQDEKNKFESDSNNCFFFSIRRRDSNGGVEGVPVAE